ncbi:hypothetical protein ABID82_005130 [Methylobacterium sp. PvP062]|uniref:Uncharacterized protein n=1 Tax=Methylobacterium radiotolerans TaxID=31998 RepID=A0ABV2NUK6_9HYPH|nr:MULTISPECIES: hypothetical protein [unclassified Methylobacterium]MBP2498444.1 hypothetical protein [Methylobacterium sp. PvP105]MBP2505623.1 hypothetical protein [Methylobacterium sp. PvP109]
MTSPNDYVSYYTYDLTGKIHATGSTLRSQYDEMVASGMLVGIGVPKHIPVSGYFPNNEVSQMVDLSGPEPVLVDRPTYDGQFEPETLKRGETATLRDVPPGFATYRTADYSDFDYGSTFAGGDYVLTARVVGRYAVIVSDTFPILPFVRFVDVTE